MNNHDPTISESPATEHAPIIVVMLRQPWLERPSEMRSDPFWEYGSFGLTGCHQRNLMHPKKASLLNGARFAFVQGGALGQRLVMLTPPVTAIAYGDRSEVRWRHGGNLFKPFVYDRAPLVVDSNGNSQMPTIKKMIENIRRESWMGRFASRFRSRRQPLPVEVAREMSVVFDSMRALAKCDDLAKRYEQALPVAPPKIDRQRRKTYRELLAKAGNPINFDLSLEAIG